MKKTILSMAVASALSTTLMADAQTDELRAQLKALTERLNAVEQQNKETDEKTNALIEETADLKTGFNFNVVDTEKSYNGMGAAASKVYYSKSPLSIGGYGEMFYASKEDADNVADVYRFVPYIGYRFNDNIVLNVELEFEHGGAGNSTSKPAGSSTKDGKVIVEFMYLDFMLSDNFNLQVGHLLTPMGLVNLRHEPTLFNTVQRPNTEKYLIPSTWHSTGILAYGNVGDTGFKYNAGIIQAIDFDTTGAGKKGTIRDARLGSSKNSTMNNVAFVGRLDYTATPGLLAGASLYYGSATQGSVSGTTAMIYDAHLSYENEGFKAKAVYSATQIDDADKLAALGTNTAGQSTEEANGYYVNVEYDVLSNMNSEYKLPIFAQYDYINPNDKVVDGTNTTIAGDVNAESATTTVGLNFFPHPQVVLKADYAMTKYENSATTKKDQDILSLSLGFIF